MDPFRLDNRNTAIESSAQPKKKAKVSKQKKSDHEGVQQNFTKVQQNHGMDKPINSMKRNKAQNICKRGNFATK